MAEQKTVLVSPDGKREWTTESPTEATNLRARGWKPKADKSTPAKTSK